MTFIYTAGGWELNAPEESRESLTEKMVGAGGVIEVKTMFISGSAPQPAPVTVAVDQIAVVSDQRLPRAGA
jgi:hypothetical protein